MLCADVVLLMFTDILKMNFKVFYITSVKFVIRNVCTEHIYCLQDVLKTRGYHSWAPIRDYVKAFGGFKI